MFLGLNGTGVTSCVLTGHDIDDSAASTSFSEAGVTASVETVLEAVDELGEEGFRFVPLREFLTGRRERKLALLTFDDGLQSLYHKLFPRLCERGIPALVFLVSGGHRYNPDPFPLWLFSLRDSRARLSDEELACLESLAEVDRVLCDARKTSLRELLSSSLGDLCQVFRETLTQAELENVADAIAEFELAPQMVLTREQIESMRASGWIEFGAHSVTHRPLSDLTRAEAEREVVESCESVAKIVDRPQSDVAFAYPFGAATPAAERIVRAKCVAGFTMHNRRLTTLDRDSSIPRVSLDPASLGRARAATRADRYQSLMQERARSRIRHGRAWHLVGPLVHGLRRIERLAPLGR